MKLLTKTTLYIATLSLFLFFLMGIIFFQVLKVMSINDLNREMKEMREPVEENLEIIIEQGMNELPGIDSLIVRQIPDVPADIREFRDTLMYDHRTGRYRTYHIYTFFSSRENDLFRVELVKSTKPSDELVEKVTLLMTLMVILFLSGIFILNRYIFTNLWKDFLTALNKLKRFNAEKGPITAQESDIQEFNELNMVLEKITGRLSEDYINLKEYTDNTTHELQTPLAVIKTKVELLLQSENLGQTEMELIGDIYKNADHLSRLNSTLALITRIENRQYKERFEVNFTGLVDQQIDMLQELIELRNIKINRKLHGRDTIVNMDQGLADVLIINLLKNAINHNIDGGVIEIELSDNKLAIRNSGVGINEDPGKIFDRFYRGSKKPDSFGLGLALVKKICDFYGFTIEKDFQDGLHSFTLTFRS